MGKRRLADQQHSASDEDDAGSEEEEVVTGHIDRLEIENFKSYLGHQKIGPFKKFTAIIGPNGSGKSNLMDAISFVLGVRTAQLRGSLKELLYHNSDLQERRAAAGDAGDAFERPRTGYVSLVFIDPSGDEIVFSRHIQPSSTGDDASYSSVYRINRRQVSWDQYNKQLETYGILVKARNFLVFQGDIEHVAAMSPKDLTSLLEHVSGSEALRKKYEELEATKNEAEEKQSFVFAKRKGLVIEKKQKKDQKEEAEKHIRLRQELDALRLEHLLYQLYCIDHDLGQAKKRTQQRAQETLEAEQAASQAHGRVEDKRKEAAAATKERMLLEKKRAKKRAELDKRNPEAARLKEEVARLSKKQRQDERTLESKKKARETQRRRLDRLKEELAEMEATAEKLEQDAEAQASKGKLEFSAALLEEYRSIKADAGAKTSKLQTDKAAQSSALQVDEEALRSAQQLVKALDDRLARIDNDVAALEQSITAAEEARVEAAASLEEKKKEHKKIADEHRKHSTMRDAYTARLEEVSTQIRDARADRKEGERDRRQQEAVETLKSIFKGKVYGRVTDLAKVAERKYNLALAVVIGRNMDSVVVEDESSAKQAIAYLKQQRLPPMTFIPLQTVQAKPINERLRSQGGSARLAIDVLQYEQRLEPAFKFVCGNTLVCDTADEARRLAFGGTERHKVVAVDGTLFSKGGCITGGLSQGMEAKAARWDDSALHKLEEEERQLQEQLEGVPTMRDAAQAEAQLSADITGLQATLGLKDHEIKDARGKLARLQKEAGLLNKRKAEQEPEVVSRTKSIEKRAAAIEALATRINEVVDRMFAPFSKKVGVTNIREYEEGALQKAEEFAQKKAEMAGKLSKLRSEIEFEEGSDPDKPIRQLEAGLAKMQDKLAKLQEQEASISQARAGVETELEQEQAAAEELRAAAEDMEGEVKALREEAKRATAAAAKLRGDAAKMQAAVEKGRSEREDLLAQAAMDQIEVPLLDAAAAAAADEGEAADGMDIDQAGPGPSSGGAAAGAESRVIDYSGLRRQHQAKVSSKEREVLNRAFSQNIEETRAKLERVAPNLKALEQYDAVREKEREQQAELDAAKAEAHKAVQEFNEVRQQRFDMFNQAFEHVANAIDAIYKCLTRSTAHPIGGTAYLSAESTDEPFLHGLKFTAMPPTKRFRDMEQLSGGEKTVAALALLFAIHSFHPSPFFVLDEIDAALDATNVSRVAAYIREKTRTGAQGAFQSIVISLKDSFYDKADGLVGVCRDIESGCSATYTFDLERFD